MTTLLERFLQEGRARMAYQPIVRLDSAEVIGFEALLRGLPDEPDLDPAKLFSRATKRGVAAELDWICQASALEDFAAAGLPARVALFLNAEPGSLTRRPPENLANRMTTALTRHSVIVEITEHHLPQQPGELLAAIVRIRDRGLGIALDDVGANPLSLALMSVIEPDVIKLDLSLVRARIGPVSAQVSDAAHAEAERTGAEVLAEGIEDVHHLNAAQALGATLGQGWRFGAPDVLPSSLPEPSHPLRLPMRSMADPATPFEAIPASLRRRVSETDLTQLLLHAEFTSVDFREPCIIITSLDRAAQLTAAGLQRYRRLAERGALAAVLAPDLPSGRIGGVTAIQVPPDDPLRDERAVVVLSATTATAVAARRGATRFNPRFDAAVTHDRALVVAAARSLLRRAGPSL